MGYMGFGMQKWIYTQKPRKYFSRTRKRAGNSDIAGNRDIFDVNKAYENTSRYSKTHFTKSFDKIEPYPVWYIAKKIIIPFVIVAVLMILIWSIFLSSIILFPAP